MLVSHGVDFRKLPLSIRKANLARLLARRVDGIFLSDFEQGEIGQDLFRHACLSRDAFGRSFCLRVVRQQTRPSLPFLPNSFGMDGH